MRSIFVPILALAVLASCTALTPKVDELTGTTIEQRCVSRDTAYNVGKAQPEYETDETFRRVVDGYRAWILANCPAPWGVAPKAPEPEAAPDAESPA